LHFCLIYRKKKRSNFNYLKEKKRKYLRPSAGKIGNEKKERLEWAGGVCRGGGRIRRRGEFWFLGLIGVGKVFSEKQDSGQKERKKNGAG